MCCTQKKKKNVCMAWHVYTRYRHSQPVERYDRIETRCSDIFSANFFVLVLGSSMLGNRRTSVVFIFLVVKKNETISEQKTVRFTVRWGWEHNFFFLVFDSCSLFWFSWLAWITEKKNHLFFLWSTRFMLSHSVRHSLIGEQWDGWREKTYEVRRSVQQVTVLDNKIIFKSSSCYCLLTVPSFQLFLELGKCFKMCHLKKRTRITDFNQLFSICTIQPVSSVFDVKRSGKGCLI